MSIFRWRADLPCFPHCCARFNWAVPVWIGITRIISSSHKNEQPFFTAAARKMKRGRKTMPVVLHHIQRMLRLHIAQAEIFACRGIGNREKRHSHTAIEDKCGWWRRDIPHAVSTSLDWFLKNSESSADGAFVLGEGVVGDAESGGER